MSGGQSLARTLRRLLVEDARDDVEVIVPLEDAHPDRTAVATAFPKARLAPVAISDRASDHERYDRRRAAGIEASLGGVVAILEDRGTPAPGWAGAVLAAHARRAGFAIGGVVGNGVDRAWNDAVWLCDFGRYAPPQTEGPRATLTDVNVSYPRELLVAVREVWTPRYHEPLVHAAMAARGATLWLDPSIVVDQERPSLPAAAAVRERLSWGFLFGRLRARELRPAARLPWAAASLVLPPLLILRALRNARGRLPSLRCVRAAPWIVVLVVAWCLGEAAGTASGSYNPLPTKTMR